ncbi:MAG TPA: CBS domain-containing protein [Methanobacterium sp.]|nr:CBS domain-containing protein [Methanobacterium sp.]
MKYSFKIFSIFGIPVELHISFLLLMLAIYLVALFNLIPGLDVGIAVLITLLFVTVVLHELSHSYIAQRYGVEIERIVLLPIGGVSAMKELPKDPHQELRIALVGPLTNLVIAAVLYPIFLFMSSSLSPSLNFLFYNFILLNLLLGAFNLLPAFPMDGGRVLRAYLAERMNFIKATETAASIGKQLAIVMAIVGIFFNPFLIFIAIFVYLGADQESKLVLINTLLEGINVKDIMTGEVKTVKPTDTVDQVLKTMFKHKHMGYPVYQEGQLLGIVTFHDISAVPEEKRDQTVENLMTRELLVTKPEEDVSTILEKMNRFNVGRLPVLEDQKLVGIISKTDIMKALEMRKKLAE